MILQVYFVGSLSLSANWPKQFMNKWWLGLVSSIIEVKNPNDWTQSVEVFIFYAHSCRQKYRKTPRFSWWITSWFTSRHPGYLSVLKTNQLTLRSTQTRVASCNHMTTRNENAATTDTCGWETLRGSNWLPISGNVGNIRIAQSLSSSLLPDRGGFLAAPIHIPMFSIGQPP